MQSWQDQHWKERWREKWQREHPAKEQAGSVTAAEAVPAQGSPQWVSASSRIYPGVKLYQSSGYYAEIADVDPNHAETNFDGSALRFSGVLLRYPDGYQEWKDRRVVLRMFVRLDDPALRRWTGH